VVKRFEQVQNFVDSDEHRKQWRGRQLNEDEKRAAIRREPVPCTDVMMYNPDSRAIMPCYRKAEPKSGWWYVGGTWQSGLLPEEAAADSVKRETGLVIAPERFEFMGITNMICEKRGWPPPKDVEGDVDERGIHYAILVYALAVTPEEAAQIRLDPSEYDQGKGIRECTREQIVDESLREELLVAYDHIFG
jgi:ADP-ribose pyrophosphatase YjhB (NUDIX family)